MKDDKRRRPLDPEAPRDVTIPNVSCDTVAGVYMYSKLNDVSTLVSVCTCVNVFASVRREVCVITPLSSMLVAAPNTLDMVAPVWRPNVKK